MSCIPPARSVALVVVGCVLLGAGVGSVLRARLGSDGYSTMVLGASLSSGLPYAFATWSIAAEFVVIAWLRGVVPGPATLIHPIVVGSAVDLLLHLGPVHGACARAGSLLGGLVLLALGVAVYLAPSLGSGPFESVALALRPLSFRLAYTTLQGLGTVAGWLMGAPVGIGTFAVVCAVGPMVARLQRWLPGASVPNNGT